MSCSGVEVSSVPGCVPCGPGMSGRVSFNGYSIIAETADGTDLMAALIKGSLEPVSVSDDFLTSNPKIIQVFKSKFTF